MTPFSRHLVSLRFVRRSVLALVATSTVAGAIALAVEATNLPRSRVRSDDPLLALAVNATADDRRAADEAIASLRAAGPAGLAAFREIHAATIAKLADQPACLCALNSAERRVADALDRIAGQRDAASSGLYWYTDFAAARAAAEREGKPILTLRMLGKLTDELSCANSRFFRTILYANQETADYLSRTFILHWQSVRPVPQITIDFGDGRKMTRTITGNSAHYVVDASGRVIDCIPGLYGPKRFRAAVKQAAEVAAELASPGSDRERRELLATYHTTQQRRVADVLTAPAIPTPVNKNTFADPKLRKSGSPLAGLSLGPRGDADLQTALATVTMPSVPNRATRQYPTAGQAAVVGASKITVENRMLLALGQVTEVELRAMVPPSRIVTGIELLDDVQTSSYTAEGRSFDKFLGAEWLASLGATIENTDLGRFGLSETTISFDYRERLRDSDLRALAGSSDVNRFEGRFLDAMSIGLRPAVLSGDRVEEADGSSTLVDRGLPREATINLAAEASTAEIRSRLAEAMRSETEFDARSLSLIRAKLLSIPAGSIPSEATAGAQAFTAAREATIERTLARLVESVAADTARNEFDLHRRIHARLADGRSVDADTLNEWVYAELFLTPNADPWLGLAPDDVFSAIDAGGLSIGDEPRGRQSPQTESDVSASTAR